MKYWPESQVCFDKKFSIFQSTLTEIALPVEK